MRDTPRLRMALSAAAALAAVLVALSVVRLVTTDHGPPTNAASSASTGPAGQRSARTLIGRNRPAGTWPGVNGLSGVNGDPVLDAASVQSFCTARGRACPIAHTYTDRTSYVSMTTGTAWTFDWFADFDGALVVSQGLVPEGGEDQMAGCASGDYDSMWRSFGTLMVNARRPDTIVRLGWEFNEKTMPWRGTSASTYISCFRHAASSIRVTDPEVLIDWTINGHDTPRNLCGGLSTNCYPGDEYVDIVGIDNYDHYPWSPSLAAFNATAAAPEGLSWLYAFARRHDKPFSVGEWGVVPTGDAGQENPDYITWMHSWFAAHAPNLAYEAYFTNCDAGGVQSSLFRTDTACRPNPRSAARYRSLYRTQ